MSNDKQVHVSEDSEAPYWDAPYRPGPPLPGKRGFALVGDARAFLRVQALEVPGHCEEAWTTARHARVLTDDVSERAIYLANQIAGRSEDDEPLSWSNEDACELASIILRLAGGA